MTRAELLAQLDDPPHVWDMIVIGGGASGLGTAVEAAGRGYRTLLLERKDFAAGTSSRSTKLIHGGIRYLKQGNLALVLDALHERGLLIRNAPHLVHNLLFVVPLYDWWEGPFYGIGLKLYDMLAGRLGLGPSRRLTREETLELIPTLVPAGLRGGVIYHDAQFDDARLAVSLARTLADLGGTPLNYMEVTGLTKAGGLITGVTVRDREEGREYRLHGRVVINATGVFADRVRRMDCPDAPAVVAPSQGVHLVLDRSFLPGECAVMVPHTDDGRVLFAVPWHGRVIVGTTDTPVNGISTEPRPLEEEIGFLLEHAARYLTRHPSRADVLSVFAGLRPLVKGAEQQETAAFSRDHAILISGSGLVTVTGGKWTTYRKMGEDTVDRAAEVAGLEPRPSTSSSQEIHGWRQGGEADPWGGYGCDAEGVRALALGYPAGTDPLHPALPYRACEVVWAVRNEYARTVEDVLARRTRALFLDAAASMAMAPGVARLMAEELGRDEAWQQRQVADFLALARGYLPE
ncbi:MAG: glycerol-3-phosphate dehydrogenase/oxidase [Deltaproteobacteria bacterium]|nr:glycerol-3-phosphate dehydrogenase/oxidase [Deltaproteobacteria bacterium]